MFTYLFLVSLFAIALLLSVKVFENTKKRRFLAMEIISKLDAPIKAKFDMSAEVLEDKKKKTIFYLKNELPKHAKSILIQTKRSIEEKYATILPNIRGNKVLNKNGKVSEFLKDITKHKEENGGGRIEE